VFMDGGKIVEEAPPETFFTVPSSERAKRFISQLQN
jgi:ABC-type polar amino acid transport system ATPase subunit